jgi:hypothetical protein
MNSNQNKKLSYTAVCVQVSDATSGHTTFGGVRVQFWNKWERLLRALKFSGMCWVAGSISIFIPLLHFILVPLFLISGPILFFFLLRQESVILGGEGTCPSCQSFLPIARSAFRFPCSDLCTRCYHLLRIELWDQGTSANGGGFDVN